MTRHYSVSQLNKRAQAIVAEACTSKEPIFISQNGRASAVIVDVDTYLTSMQALDEFMRIYKKESSIKPAPKSAVSPFASN